MPTTTSSKKVLSLTPKTSKISFDIDPKKGKHLVIVESPAKCKTIGKYLGPNFTVMASYGHIVELAKKNMGIDVENGFAPQYEIDPDKKKVVSELKKVMKSVDQVWIATDEDREGEAIGRHVANALGLKVESTPRITFHEITKPALEKAITSPRTLDMDLINAQQARRVLDRLVGFQLSPLLWKKIRTGLSAGRVQSVAVRLIVDREKEIQSFVPTPSIQTQALFSTPAGSFLAKADVIYSSVDEAKIFLTQASESMFSVSSVIAKPAKKSPSAPFTTSTLQQEASRKIGFSVAQTMRVAQKLYEAGAITYMRTDSVAMSGTAIAGATKEIEARFGKESVQVRKWTNKKSSAQEAHECIRPTDFSREIAGSDSVEQKLYRLIWQRSIASQMTDAQAEKTTVKIDVSGAKTGFTATGEVIKEPGFLQAYGIDPKKAKLEQEEDEEIDAESGSQGLPILEKGQLLDLMKMTSLTSYDRYPARYTEASLVKKLESEGIGRPSTYAPTISTIIKRQYVILEDREGVMKDFDKLELIPATNKNSEGTPLGNFLLTQETIKKPYGSEKKKLFPTDTGTIVTDFLIEHFPDIVDYGFTAKVEEEFDEIAEGKRDWKKMLSSFYTPFSVLIQKSGGDTVQRATGERILGTDPKSGKQVSARLGRFGAFVQIGESDDPDKKYASLKPGQRLDTVTFEEALSCFDLPRNLGDYKGSDIIIAIGRFGPYAKYGSMFVSLGRDNDPYTIDYDTAVVLIEKKIESDANKIITSFEYQGEHVSIENGRYGPFIRFGKKNIKIPKTMHEGIKKVSQKQWKELIDAA
ncbi:DNA topoisomerase 1 [candidate division SR1 bacterium Aalborg_AAW-1]|nr:DNA topoisomerase 1 [candidate division SR1 bacterium Aalborg_AAW-1]